MYMQQKYNVFAFYKKPASRIKELVHKNLFKYLCMTDEYKTFKL